MTQIFTFSVLFDSISCMDLLSYSHRIKAVVNVVREALRIMENSITGLTPAPILPKIMENFEIY